MVIITNYLEDWSRMLAEQDMFNDLVLLPHREDYDRLNQKTHRWLQRSTCFHIPDYVIKVDDDT